MNANIVWNGGRPRRLTWTKLAALTVALVATVLGSKGSAGHRAHLSDGLLRLEAARSNEKVRVIVHGSREELQALALRQGVGIVRWLNGGAVVAANGHDLARLAADNLVDHLSDDPIVQTSMSVSNKSTGAAQTRAGVPGLLGIGAIPGVTGQGIGIAIIDSGIANHSALTNKVVANVSFVTGDSSTDDAYGHGTHVAGIIAGLGGPSVTSLAAAAAFEMAGCGPEDIDVAQLQDTDSGAEIMHMAENGFCPDGEQERLLENGETRLGGSRPINTDGGCIACGEPIGASGLRQVYENVVQLRNQAGSRQVGRPRMAYSQVYGAPGVAAVSILGR